MELATLGVIAFTVLVVVVGVWLIGKLIPSFPSFDDSEEDVELNALLAECFEDLDHIIEHPEDSLSHREETNDYMFKAIGMCIGRLEDRVREIETHLDLSFDEYVGLADELRRAKQCLEEGTEYGPLKGAENV